MTIASFTAHTAWPAFLIGGQKSGKTRRAEQMARDWLDADAQHEAVYLATGQAWDAEMRQRIARHQTDRTARVPGMRTAEAPLHLAQALQSYSQPQTLIVVDCLTMWLTNWMMPAPESESNQPLALDWQGQRALFLEVLGQCPGPVVVVGNEIGLGVIPMGEQVRAFVDALGVLNQEVARACASVTLMAAGLPLALK
ncbi:MAG: bifunctional adenosylcobinamide kinase/adenosylcobinamide-phosphate guanylyltransferase [Comamonas sp.]|nr:bifunctional adenosylcobinamide kinase/adenosylcobinamide-phosphate guanylyltransferase [Candidatus Comamonas equi]